MCSGVIPAKWSGPPKAINLWRISTPGRTTPGGGYRARLDQAGRAADPGERAGCPLAVDLLEPISGSQSTSVSRHFVSGSCFPERHFRILHLSQIPCDRLSLPRLLSFSIYWRKLLLSSILHSKHPLPLATRPANTSMFPVWLATF